MLLALSGNEIFPVLVLDFTPYIESYGAAALFAFAFLGATILPLSSEIPFVAALAGGMSPTTALFAASTGNCLACLLNYGLGSAAGRPLLRKMLRKRNGRIAYYWLRRFEMAALFFSWTPVFGDLITVAAGIIRIPLVRFYLIVFTTRSGRYALIAYFMSSGS